MVVLVGEEVEEHQLGYDVLFALDATHTFDREGPDGETMMADELARATATNLHGEFAKVVTTAQILDSLHFDDGAPSENGSDGRQS